MIKRLVGFILLTTVLQCNAEANERLIMRYCAVFGEAASYAMLARQYGVSRAEIDANFDRSIEAREMIIDDVMEVKIYHDPSDKLEVAKLFRNVWTNRCLKVHAQQ